MGKKKSKRVSKKRSSKSGEYSKSCIAALVFGVLSIAGGWFPFFGWIVIILALIFGYLGYNDTKKNKKLKGQNLAVAGIILAAIGMILAYMFFTQVISPTTDAIGGCQDVDCFIEKANNCEYVTMEYFTNNEGYYYQANECEFLKTIIFLDPNESEEIKALLDGKTMTCKYAQGEFNPEWVNSNVNGLEDCVGDLKDTLVQLSVFI